MLQQRVFDNINYWSKELVITKRNISMTGVIHTITLNALSSIMMPKRCMSSPF